MDISGQDISVFVSVCVADCVSVLQIYLYLFQAGGLELLRLENLENVSVDVVYQYASVLEYAYVRERIVENEGDVSRSR